MSSNHDHAHHDHAAHAATAKPPPAAPTGTIYTCPMHPQIRRSAPGTIYTCPMHPQIRRSAPGTIYTCPMDPQIRRSAPDFCPICGMALEPELVTAESGPNPELADMSRRFWISLVLTLPVFALEMGGHLTNLHMILGQQRSNWLQLLLAPRWCCGADGRSSCAAGTRPSIEV